jgi:hypothetical protein
MKEYFGQPPDGDCGHCDNCDSGLAKRGSLPPMERPEAVPIGRAPVPPLDEPSAHA